jgi:AcrR family transcriptional regulator
MDMSASTSRKRPYHSPRRAEQARLTVDAIIAAAGKLFADKGYVAVSMEAIAEAAGVRRATVFDAVGNKATIIKEAYRRALAEAAGGEPDGTPLMDRPGSRDVREAARSTEYLMNYAFLSASVSAQIAGIYEAIREAARVEAEIAQLWKAIDAERRVEAQTVIAGVKARIPLRAGLHQSIAADIVATLSEPSLFRMFVHQRGWPAARFAAWLSNALISELLGQ